MAFNPLFDNRFVISKYKVRVTLIYDWGHDCNFAEYQPIKDFCSRNNIAFAARGFDTFRYFEDREYVLKLPAFQVYVLDEYERTIYPSAESLQELQAVILGVKVMEAEEKRRRLLFYQRLSQAWSYLTWIVPRRREQGHTLEHPEVRAKPRKGNASRRPSFAGSVERMGSSR